MKHTLFSFLILFASQANAQQAFTSQDSVTVKAFYSIALNNAAAYDDLRVLCKSVGHRLAGSEAAGKAVTWGVSVLNGIGLDSVYTMPVTVPHWVRGKEEHGVIIARKEKFEIPLRALGGSVGTNGTLRAEIIEVKDFEDLRAKGDLVKGKIVFINKAFDPALINTGAAYGNTYPIRSDGASESAKYGAVGCIIRSLTSADDKFPHTGAMHYKDGVDRIPAAAISSMESHHLHELLKNGKVEFEMRMDCQLLEPVIQANVIGEIRGSVHPERIIVIGGHLDSWDIGEGAHDDGTGVVQSIEVLRLMKLAGYKPSCTIRCVLFMNEEFGNDGGKTYAKSFESRTDVHHVAAIESDGGGFTPRGFTLDGGSEEQLNWLNNLQPFFDPYNLFIFKRGGSGVDISPLKPTENIMLFGLNVDGTRYFDFHHTDNDRFENVNQRELEMGAASMASLVYFIDLLP
jgi:carboxypeptidase Q